MANPLTPLDVFRREIGFNPFHFWQLTNERMPLNSECNTLVKEGMHLTTQALGREDIRLALSEAENAIVQYMGYDIAPRYRSETLPYSGLPLQLPHGYVRALGTEMLNWITETTVQYLDRDGDGIKETFEITFATTITDPDEIVVFFIAADRIDAEPIEIKPIDISISAGTATITGRSWLMVRPINYHGYNLGALDPDVPGVQAATVDVFRRTADSTNAITVNYANGETHTLLATDPIIVDTRLGMIGLNSYCRVWPSHCGYPVSLTVNYVAGWHAPQDWYRAVCALAATYMEGGICSCDVALKRLHYWRQDMNKMTAEQISITQPLQYSNPLGTKIGHDLAWRVMLQYPKIGHAIGV